MSEAHPHHQTPEETSVYQIRIAGHLGRHWMDWFVGLDITLQDNGDTLLTGAVVDQAALYGVLKKLRDLGIPLLSVNRIPRHPNDISNQPV